MHTHYTIVTSDGNSFYIIIYVYDSTEDKKRIHTFEETLRFRVDH